MPVRTLNGNNLSHCMFVVRCVLCSGAECSYSAVQVVSPLSWRPSAEHVVYSLRKLFLSLFTLQISKIKNPERAFARRRISHFACLSRTLPAGRVLSY